MLKLGAPTTRRHLKQSRAGVPKYCQVQCQRNLKSPVLEASRLHVYTAEGSASKGSMGGGLVGGGGGDCLGN